MRAARVLRAALQKETAVLGFRPTNPKPKEGSAEWLNDPHGQKWHHDHTLEHAMNHVEEGYPGEEFELGLNPKSDKLLRSGAVIKEIFQSFKADKGRYLDTIEWRDVLESSRKVTMADDADMRKQMDTQLSCITGFGTRIGKDSDGREFFSSSSAPIAGVGSKSDTHTHTVEC